MTKFVFVTGGVVSSLGKGIAAASLVFAFISFDGESNWLEGLQLLGLYIIAGAVFFFLPVAETVAGH